MHRRTMRLPYVIAKPAVDVARPAYNYPAVCNRYSQTKERIKLALEFAGILEFELVKRFNIAPTQEAQVVAVQDRDVTLLTLRWGFDGPAGPVTNARSETAHEKPMFRDACQRGHCLVPADGFYEWKNTPDGKQPYRFVLRTRESFWFAGLCEGDRFTILTAPSRGCVTPLHDREPVILRTDALEVWLLKKPWTPVDVIDRRISLDALECYPVARAMSNARNTGPECIEPIVLPQREFGFV